MYILIAKAMTWFRRRGRRKGPGPDSVQQPREVLAQRKHTVLVLDEKGFPPSPPQSRWASLTPAQPLWGSLLAGGQRLHLESIISVLGSCTEPLEKRKPEKQVRDESECFLLPDWPATTWWQGLSQEHKSDFFFLPAEIFIPEWFFSVCVVQMAVTYLKARYILNNCYENMITANHPNCFCRSLEYILFVYY